MREERAQATIALAVVLIESQTYEAARSRLEETLALLTIDEISSGPTAHLVDAWVRLGDAYAAQGGIDPAIDEYRRALKVAEITATRVDDAAVSFRLAYIDALRGNAPSARDGVISSVALLRDEGHSQPVWSIRAHDYAALIGLLGPSHIVEETLAAESARETKGVPRMTFKPQLKSDLPTGWFAKESITLLAPDGQANVIASSEPLDESLDSRAYADAQGDILRTEFPAYNEVSYIETEILGGEPASAASSNGRRQTGSP